MFCKFCGSQIDDDSVFCNKCGKEQNAIRKPISITLETFQPNTITCPSCDKAINADSVVCEYCNYQIIQNKKVKKAVFWVLTIGIAVLFIYFFTNTFNQSLDKIDEQSTKNIGSAQMTSESLLEDLDKTYKNTLLAELINWSYDFDTYGKTKVGTNKTYINAQGEYCVIYNFTAPNQYGTHEKHYIAASLDFSDVDDVNITSIVIDGEKVA